jgi:hypothetical protein
VAAHAGVAMFRGSGLTTAPPSTTGRRMKTPTV